MSWVKSGDNAATYPALLEVAADPDADDRTLNEAAGFLWRCASLTASHETDYFIAPGTAALVAGARSHALIQVCMRTGLLIAGTDPRSQKKGWFIAEDPDFLHMIKRDEKEWEKQQKNDARDPRLKVPLLLRDGLLCRFCGVRTQLRGRPSNRTFTVHHLDPGQPAKDATQAVVACMGCNSAIRDDVDGSWARQHPLMPPPREPYLDRSAAAYLAENGYPMSPTTGPAPDVVQAVAATEWPADADDEKDPEKEQKGVFTPISQPTKKDYGGTGRDGTGRAGQGRNGPERAGTGLDGQVKVNVSQGRKRKRRGRRGGGGQRD